MVRSHGRQQTQQRRHYSAVDDDQSFSRLDDPHGGAYSRSRSDSHHMRDQYRDAVSSSLGNHLYDPSMDPSSSRSMSDWQAVDHRDRYSYSSRDGYGRGGRDDYDMVAVREPERWPSRGSNDSHARYSQSRTDSWDEYDPYKPSFAEPSLPVQQHIPNGWIDESLPVYDSRRADSAYEVWRPDTDRRSRINSNELSEVEWSRDQMQRPQRRDHNQQHSQRRDMGTHQQRRDYSQQHQRQSRDQTQQYQHRDHNQQRRDYDRNPHQEGRDSSGYQHREQAHSGQKTLNDRSRSSFHGENDRPRDDVKSWDVALPVENDRSWQPAPGWEERARRTERSSQNGRHNKQNRSVKSQNYSSQQRQNWQAESDDFNNWQRRDERSSNSTKRKQDYFTRSRSRSPADSHYSRTSYRVRSRSPSSSPVTKRARHDVSPAQSHRRSPSPVEFRGRTQFSGRRDDEDSSSRSPHQRSSRRRRSLSSVSSYSSGQSRSPVRRQHNLSRDLPEESFPATSSRNHSSPQSRQNGNAESSNGITLSPAKLDIFPPPYVHGNTNNSSHSDWKPGRTVEVSDKSSLPPASSQEISNVMSPFRPDYKVEQNSVGQTSNMDFEISNATIGRATFDLDGFSENGQLTDVRSSDKPKNPIFVPASSIVLSKENESPSNGNIAQDQTSLHMPPPSSLPVAKPQTPAVVVSVPKPRHLPTLSVQSPIVKPGGARIGIKKAGFKPIGQTSQIGSSSLRRFFPGDDDDADADADALTGELSQTNDTESEKIDDGPIDAEPGKVDAAIGETSTHRSTTSTPALSDGVKDMSASPMHEAENHLLQTPVETKEVLLADSLTSKKEQTEESARESARPTSQSQNEAEDNDPPGELFSIVTQVGEGTFGKVYKAQNTISKLYVALKRIRMESERDGFPVTAMREIKLLQSLRHQNVVRLYEMMVSSGNVYMVFEYMDHDLTGILSQTQFNFTDGHLKSLCHQMLNGLAYLHHKGVIHRDVKGSNILVNNRGELKLADFGLARFYQKRRRSDYTNRVITLWYRPPELLFGATVYGPEVDMWSAGCIMLELFTKKPVFQGEDEIHQLEVIYKVLGTPTAERWPSVVNLPWYELVKPPVAIPNHFRELFRRWMSPAALDLAEQLLVFDPVARVTAIQAMEALYFKEEEPPAEMPSGLSTLQGEWHELETKRERAKKRRRESASTSTAQS